MSKKQKVDTRDKQIKNLLIALQDQALENAELEELCQSLKTIIWYLEIKIGLFRGEDDGNQSV